MEYRTAGESHGRALVALVTGVPAGIALSSEAIDADLARRQAGYGRGGRMAIERDRGLILSGVRFGSTIGSPVAITIANRDWDNWTDVMSVCGDADGARRVTAPRPGHADLAGAQRIGTDDVRDILERASARETAARVAAGAVAKALLAELGVRVWSWVESIGGVAAGPWDAAEIDIALVESSDVRCPEPGAAAEMRAAIDAARDAGESLGGVVAVAADGLVPGLGSYAERGRGLDALLAGAVMSIPAIKGVEIGDGFAAASRPGSRVHDPIVRRPGGLARATNHAGGLEGGMTNGEPLILRAAMKPIPTLMTPLATVDLESGEIADAARERSDVCAVPAAGVVAEAEVAIVLADAYTRMFGDTCIEDIRTAIARYRERCPR
ncbi:MAG: chorismate synthase [Coriobacteriia bacterium]|nr:chorismate synthase [Coriobacteriia bacterium]